MNIYVTVCGCIVQFFYFIFNFLYIKYLDRPGCTAYTQIDHNCITYLLAFFFFSFNFTLLARLDAVHGAVHKEQKGCRQQLVSLFFFFLFSPLVMNFSAHHIQLPPPLHTPHNVHPLPQTVHTLECAFIYFLNNSLHSCAHRLCCAACAVLTMQHFCICDLNYNIEKERMNKKKRS